MKARSTLLEYANLDRFFYPRTVAIINAPGAAAEIANALVSTVTQSFTRGPVYRVTADDDGGVTFPEDVSPEAVDLAVIVAPPQLQSGIACACDDQRIPAALLFNATEREPVPADITAELDRLHARCRHGMRILGPQSFGIIVPPIELNLTLRQPLPRAGRIAFISESSAMCAAVLDWSFRTGVGFSAVVGCDTMPDVSWADLITHFGDDPQTRSIVVYLERAGDARAFLSAAREVALNKPIILLKSRRSSRAEFASPSMTVRPPRSDAVFEAALRRVGVLRVRTVSEMFYMANILAKQPLPRGPRLAILTNAPAPAMLATDSLLASGGALATLDRKTAERIAGIIGETDPAVNPINLRGDANADRYAEALAAMERDSNIDGLLVLLTPQPTSEPTRTARLITETPTRASKPLLASWMGGDRVAEGQDIMFRAGVPSFPYPDTPARMFALMWRHAQNLNAIYETPDVIIDEERLPISTESATAFLDELRAGGQTVLSAEQAATVLRYYGIIAEPDAAPPRHAYKLLVGSRVDPVFGPYMVFGIGGRMSAIYDDTALGLPPLTSALARRMMEESAVWKVLRSSAEEEAHVSGSRLSKLQALLVRLSQLVVQQPAIRRLTINPLFVSGDHVIVTGASINLQNPSIAAEELPRPAIRPYPVQYTWHETARGGAPFIIRPIRPEDEPLIVNFHRLLTEETIYRRYFFQHKFSRRTSHERLRRTCFLDFDREIALAALLPGEGQQKRGIGIPSDAPTNPDRQVIAAVGRLARNRRGDSAEIALVVADPYQSQGIGTTILRHLIDIARAENVTRLTGTMLPGNIHMQHLFGKLGFNIRPGADDTVVAELML